MPSITLCTARNKSYCQFGIGKTLLSAVVQVFPDIIRCQIVRAPAHGSKAK
jgi:hypothetical protein